MADLLAELKFRDPQRARALSEAIHREVKAVGLAPVPIMHVCGSHEQAIAQSQRWCCWGRQAVDSGL